MRIEHGMAIAAAASGAGVGVTGDVFARRAAELNDQTIAKGVKETAEQTTQRLNDADWYERWGDDLHVTAFTLLSVAALLVIAGLARRETR